MLRGLGDPEWEVMGDPVHFGLSDENLWADWGIEDPISWSVGEGVGWFGQVTPWIEGSVQSGAGGPGTWELAQCGPTPGGLNCDELSSRFHPGGGKRKKANGSGAGDRRAERGRLLCGPIGPVPTSGRGEPASDGSKEFVFTNPYSAQSVRFTERQGKDEPCATNLAPISV